LTYQQAQKAGAQVRKGEKSTTIVFTKKLHIKEKETDEDKQIGMLRTFAVFNVAQIDGLPEPEHVEIPIVQRLANVDCFIAATKADVRIGGNMACYVPSMDFIALPRVEAFVTVESFYARRSAILQTPSRVSPGPAGANFRDTLSPRRSSS
jgi:antirestriction protein ArdC